MNTKFDELSDLIYKDEIIYTNDLGDSKKIYKHKYNFSFQEIYLINKYSNFYNLKKEDIENIKRIINRYIWNSYIIEILNNSELKLKEEAKKIQNAIDIIIDSKALKNDEQELDYCFQIIIERYRKIALDLINLSNEKYTISPKNKDLSKVDNNYIYKVIRKYPNLNPIVILSAFKQSKKTLATELAHRLIEYITNLEIPNNKNTKITANTIQLIKDLFEIKINDRDLSTTNNLLSITRYFIP